MNSTTIGQYRIECIGHSKAEGYMYNIELDNQLVTTVKTRSRKKLESVLEEGLQLHLEQLWPDYRRIINQEI